MRAKRTAQTSLFDPATVDHPVAEELEWASAWLDAHPELLDEVAADLGAETGASRGRHGLTCETILRCAVLKHLRQETCRGLEFTLRDSRSAQRFARVDVARLPKKSALQATMGAVRATTWERINRLAECGARRGGGNRGAGTYRQHGDRDAYPGTRRQPPAVRRRARADAAAGRGARPTGGGRGGVPRSPPGGQTAGAGDPVATRCAAAREDLSEAVAVGDAHARLRRARVAGGGGDGRTLGRPVAGKSPCLQRRPSKWTEHVPRQPSSVLPAWPPRRRYAPGDRNRRAPCAGCGVGPGWCAAR